jgi:hypothetical protein
MRKASSREEKDDLRFEYDLTKLKKVGRGKYYKQAMAGTNLVLVDPDLAKVFPDSASVNRALRILCDAADKSTQPSRRSIKKSAHRKRSAA